MLLIIRDTADRLQIPHTQPFPTKENLWEHMAKGLNHEFMGFRERIAFGGQATADGLGRYSVAMIHLSNIPSGL